MRLRASMQASLVVLCSPCPPITAAAAVGQRSMRASSRTLLRRASSQLSSRAASNKHGLTRVSGRQINTSIPEPAVAFGRQWRGLRASPLLSTQHVSAAGNAGPKMSSSAIRAVVTAPAPAPIQEGDWFIHSCGVVSSSLRFELTYCFPLTSACLAVPWRHLVLVPT